VNFFICLMKNEITEKEVGEFDNVSLCIITFSAVTPVKCN